MTASTGNLTEKPASLTGGNHGSGTRARRTGRPDIPRPKRPPQPLILKYLKASNPARAEAGSLGELRPVEPAAWREGVPLLGDGQVYVMKYGREFHTRWCQLVADKWAHAPRGLLLTMLADIGARSRCRECGRPGPAASSREGPRDGHAPEPPGSAMVIPLRVVGIAHGILFLAARAEYRALLGETAVEPATPLLVRGRRDGTVVRVDVMRDEPLLVVQMDPRATFLDGPYQVRLRPPLRRSATKPYAVELIEPAAPAQRAR